MKKPLAPWLSHSFLGERNDSLNLLEGIFRHCTEPTGGPVTIKSSLTHNEREYRSNEDLYGSELILGSTTSVEMSFQLSGEQESRSIAYLENVVYGDSKELNPVVSLWVSGVGLDRPQSKTQEAIALGDRAYTRLKEICLKFDPLLGSICVEDRLSSPSELIADPWNVPFRNFYASQKLGEATLDEFSRILEGLYQERLETGIYFSDWEWLNPMRITRLGKVNEESTKKVAILLANYLRSNPLK